MALGVDVSCAWKLILDVRRVAPGVDWRPLDDLLILPDGSWTASCTVSSDAAALFDTLLPIARSGPDYVIAQIGQSLDGRIATASGCSHYVTGEASRVHLHRLRALVDAVVVGAGTVVADDPRLTVRHVEGNDPVRVVLDPNGRVPHSRRVFTDGGPPTWHAVYRRAAAASGAVSLYLEDNGGAEGVPDTLLTALAERGLRRVLVEGGGITISHFVAAGRVDRLHVVVAPILIGAGRSALKLAGVDTLDHALRPVCMTYTMGNDRLYDLNLRQAADGRTGQGDRPSGVRDRAR